MIQRHPRAVSIVHREQTAPAIQINLLSHSEVAVDVAAVDTYAARSFCAAVSLRPNREGDDFLGSLLTLVVAVFTTHIRHKNRRRCPCKSSVHNLGAVSGPQLISKPSGCADDGVSRMYNRTAQNVSPLTGSPLPCGSIRPRICCQMCWLGVSCESIVRCSTYLRNAVSKRPFFFKSPDV